MDILVLLGLCGAGFAYLSVKLDRIEKTLTELRCIVSEHLGKNNAPR
jgi:hypothetical protein